MELTLNVVEDFRLTLRDQWSIPLTHARVWLEHEMLGSLGDFTLNSAGVLIRDGKTPLGRYRLHVAAPAMPVAQFQVEIVGSSMDPILLLMPAAYIQAKIVRDQVPLKDVQVRVFRESESLSATDRQDPHSHAYDLASAAMTDHDGVFRTQHAIGFGIIEVEVQLPSEGRVLRSSAIQYRKPWDPGTPIEVR